MKLVLAAQRFGESRAGFSEVGGAEGRGPGE